MTADICDHSEELADMWHGTVHRPDTLDFSRTSKRDYVRACAVSIHLSPLSLSPCLYPPLSSLSLSLSLSTSLLSLVLSLSISLPLLTCRPPPVSIRLSLMCAHVRLRLGDVAVLLRNSKDQKVRKHESEKRWEKHDLGPLHPHLRTPENLKEMPRQA